jgi:hypothetical protein
MSPFCREMIEKCLVLICLSARRQRRIGRDTENHRLNVETPDLMPGLVGIGYE